MLLIPWAESLFRQKAQTGSQTHLAELLKVHDSNDSNDFGTDIG